MDQDDHGHEFFRLNEAVISCTDHQVPINIITTTSSNIISPNNPTFSGPVVLLDDHDIHDDDHSDDNRNTMVAFQRNKATDDESNHLIMKTQIANHPAYPDLLAAYIQCKKVGAPPEMEALLEEIRRSEKQMMSSRTSQIGDDPELDCFMESYCEALQRFKEELCKPFNEAITFLYNTESQLSNLCGRTLITNKTLDYYGHSGESNNLEDQYDEDEEMMQMRRYADEVVDINDDEIMSYGGTWEGDYYYYDEQHLKEKLLNKYSGYLTMLKTEFMKKRKKVELPKPARTALLQWWNSHSRWPYPTEEEKVKLSEETGLDQKQINNWFVNQRKRHWKPNEDIKSALVNNSPS